MLALDRAQQESAQFLTFMSKYTCHATSAGQKAGRLSTNQSQFVDTLSTNKAYLLILGPFPKTIVMENIRIFVGNTKCQTQNELNLTLIPLSEEHKLVKEGKSIRRKKQE